MQGLARSIVAVPEALAIEVIHTQLYQKVLGKLTMQYEMVVFQTVWDSRTAKIRKKTKSKLTSPVFEHQQSSDVFPQAFFVGEKRLTNCHLHLEGFTSSGSDGTLLWDGGGRKRSAAIQTSTSDVGLYLSRRFSLAYTYFGVPTTWNKRWGGGGRAKEN